MKDTPTAYCASERVKGRRFASGAKLSTTTNGKLLLKGRCATCGKAMARFISKEQAGQGFLGDLGFNDILPQNIKDIPILGNLLTRTLF